MSIRRQRTFRLDLEQFGKAVEAQAAQLAEDLGKEMVDHMWSAYDRPTTGRGFTNRTYNLRRSIRAAVKINENKVVLQLSAGMSYSGYVETIKGGEYAYLGPTLQDMLPVAERLIEDRLAVATVYRDRMQSQRARYLDLLAKGRAAEKAERATK